MFNGTCVNFLFSFKYFRFKFDHCDFFFFVSLFVYLSIELFFDLREKVRKKDSDEEFVTVECKQFSIDKILR